MDMLISLSNPTVVIILCMFQNIPLILCNTPIPVVIRGQNEFVPCTYEPDPGELKAHILTCDEEASREFGNQLPIIQADQIPLSEIRIRGTPEMTHCPNRAFQDVNLDVDRARGHLGSVVRRVEISGAGIIHIEPQCLDGLFTVKELRILNAPGSESGQNKELAQNLFRGLQGLRNLEILHLVHVDLSGGIPAHGLGNWTDELRYVHLERNRLGPIDSDAFYKSGTYRSVLRELRIEGQLEAWRLIKNMPQWARRLVSLRTLSWRRSQLQPPPEEGIIQMDLSQSTNSKLINLILDDCELTRLVSQRAEHLPGLSLDPLGPYLQELSVNRNNFGSMESVDRSLVGLRVLSQLRLLRLEYNRTPLNRLPEWFSYGGLDELRELRLRKSGLSTILSNSFPSKLQRLHLSANPLRYVDANWMNNNRQGLNELHLNHIRLASVDIGGHWADWARALKPIADTLHVLSLAGCQIEPDVLNLESKESPLKSPSLFHGDKNASEMTIKPIVHLGLNDLKQLRTLVLSDNELTYVPIDAFHALINLKHLVLAGNLLGSITLMDVSRRPFQSNTSRRHRLQRLDLRFNQLQSLDRCASMFGLGEPLEEIIPQQPIWLTGENSPTIDRNPEPHAIGVQDDPMVGLNDWFGGLSLTGNPFVCDCRLSWLRSYISRMDSHVIQSVPDQTFPSGYRSYRSEALDFVCADAGPWRGRKFLSLKPIDLYAVRHDQCQKEPEIYGDGMQIEKALTPCRMVLAQDINGSNRPSGHMLMGPGDQVRPLGSGLEKKINRTSGKKSSETMGISLEAFILVIIASVASLCFVIISIIIILWLCLRLKRQENWRKAGTYSRGKPVGENRSKFFVDCFSNRCCSSRTRHSAGKTVTVGSYSTTGTVIKSYGALRNPRSIESEYGPTSMDSSDAGTVYEEPVESYYSQMSDVEIVTSTTAPRSSATSRPIPLKRRTRRPIYIHQQIKKDGEFRINNYDSGKTPSYCPTVDGDMHSAAVTRNSDARSTMSLDQGGGPPPRLVPLPPVPAQRKTKSTADIHMYLTDNEWRPRVGPRHKLSLPSPHDPRGPEHTASLNALSTTARRSLTRSMHSDSRDQQYTQPTLRYRQWPDANVVNRHTDGSIRNSDIINPDSFARTRLTRSTGSRNRVPADQSLNWLRASRRKLERSFDWLRRTARRNGRSPASSQKTGAHGMTTNEKQDSLMSKQLKLQEEEEYRRMQGPELPRPQIVLVPKLTSPTESTNNFKLRHEYLPMQNDVGRQPSESSITASRITKPDEYVTEFTERPLKIANSESLKRKQPHSDGDESPPPMHQRPLRLSDNLYTLSLYEEAPGAALSEPEEGLEIDLPPPPPPPPPSKLMINQPQNAWIQHKCNPRGNDSGYSDVNTQPAQLPKVHPRRPPPSPILPKPNEMEQEKALQKTTDNRAIETEVNV